MTNLNDIPVVILCGGNGIYIDDSVQRVVKPLVRVAGVPLVIHVAACYVAAGFRKFIFCTGYQQDKFAPLLTSQYGAEEKEPGVFSLSLKGQTCQIRLVDTGEKTSTGDRLKKVETFLTGPLFAMTYSDSISTIDLAKEANFHQEHGKIGTMLGTRVPTRFLRILGLRFGDNMVRGFATKPVVQNDYINGGFYFFNKGVFQPQYWRAVSPVVLEESVLEALAADGQLMVFPYDGPWQYLDADRHLPLLEQLVKALP